MIQPNKEEVKMYKTVFGKIKKTVQHQSSDCYFN